jgi:nucleoside-diphosphate-sugar epimerase
MSKVLVTGAAGFIGFQTVQKLLAEGHNVTGIDNFEETLNSNVHRRKKVRNFNHPCFNFLEADILNYDLNSLLDGVNAVFHFAATPGLVPSWTNFEAYLNNNVLASFKLAEAIHRSHTTCKVILASTSSVYGELAVGDESTAISPSSPYGITKISSEQIFTTLLGQSECDLFVLRLFSVYGPNQREDMAWQKVIRSVDAELPFPLTAQPNHFRTCTYVGDVAELCNSIIVRGGNSGIYNISGNQEVNILEGLKLIEELMGKPLKIIDSPKRKGDQIRTSGDSSLAKQYLGFKPRTDFRVGIQNQIDSFFDQKK